MREHSLDVRQRVCGSWLPGAKPIAGVIISKHIHIELHGNVPQMIPHGAKVSSISMTENYCGHSTGLFDVHGRNLLTSPSSDMFQLEIDRRIRLTLHILRVHQPHSPTFAHLKF
jgi:hypothetical protein